MLALLHSVNQNTVTTQGLGQQILQYTAQSKRRNWSHHNQQREDLLDACLEDNSNENYTTWLKKLVSSMNRNDARTRSVVPPQITEQRAEYLKGLFLQRLRFHNMNDREKRIPKAYESTFEWIFGDVSQGRKPLTGFEDWILTGSGMFWITGKAGSGKSTLMKFIIENELRTKTGLQKWAAGHVLITAAFYLWNSGTEMQMSTQGLLQSLLHQILKQCPVLIPEISPQRWESLCLFTVDEEPWTTKELEEVIRLVAQHTDKRMKFCFFIDGLDEFHGDLDELLALLGDLARMPNFKICVSSRPWVVFEDALSCSGNLMLQNLTYPDIKHYVDSTMSKNPGFARLRKHETECANHLVEGVVSKASGVFLWVTLAVKSLLSGLQSGDRVSDLQRRLDSLPPDLEDLYKKILDSVEPFYVGHTHQLFQIFQSALRPPNLLFFSCADEEIPKFALGCPINPMSQEQEFNRAETMRRRLDSRCKGLLDVASGFEDWQNVDESAGARCSPSTPVAYLHRTVKDYLEKQEVRESFSKGTADSFDPNLALYGASLVKLKISKNTDLPNKDSLWSMVDDCFEYARKVKPEHNKILVDMLDELNHVADTLARNTFKSNGPWPGMLYDLGPDWCDYRYGLTFLSAAVQNDLLCYVESKITPGCLVHQQQYSSNPVWPLLHDALATENYRLHLRSYRSHEPNAAMVKLLLQNGADPNVYVNGVPLYKCVQPNTDWNEKWIEVLKLLIDYGADLNKIDISRFPVQIQEVLFEKSERSNRNKGKSWLHWSANILLEGIEMIAAGFPPPEQQQFGS